MSRPRKRTWRIYSERKADGTFEVYVPGQGPETKLPKGALISADGCWAEIHGQKGLERVLVASAV